MKNTALRDRRRSLSLSQAEVAFQAGITTAAYNYYEQGKRKPSVDIAIRIAHALSVFDFREFQRLWQFNNS